MKRRWSVTYTKHIKQKRKIYQDGFLDFHFSTNKVVLFDDGGKLLECRILNDGEVVSSGETLTFNSFLVDVGDREVGDNDKPTISDFNLHGGARKITQRPNLMRRQKFTSPSISSFDRKDNMKKNEAQMDLSASQKIIREFKKKELQRHGAPEGSPDILKGSREWQVLYTTQVTQKAKKFHDGFLQLAACESLGSQVMLYDANRKLLTRKVLKPDETVISGGSVSLEGYLIDIGAPEGDCKPLEGLNIQQNTCSIAGKTRTMHLQQSFKNNIAVGKEWKILYTKQMTQKTKKYNDGFLRIANFGSLRRQIMLYDASKKLLDSRFLKKNEMISSGESISFDAYLVDIGEPEGENQLPEDLNIHGNNSNDVDKAAGAKHGRLDCLQDNSSVAKEWQALYTTHVTQKAKKYHSGILRLASCGSCRLQVVLLNEDKTILSSKFLSLSEDVKSGSMFALPKYLVEVGEPVLSPEGKYQNVSCSRGDADSRSISVKDTTKSSNTIPNKPLRSACQILSILQKPIVQGRVTVRDIDKSSNAPILSKDCQFPRESLLHQGPSQNLDVRGSSETLDVDVNLFSSKVTPTFGSDQLPNDTEAAGNSDQSPPAHVEASTNCGGEAFASCISSLVGACTHAPLGDETNSVDQPTSARKVDECPTFDLGI